MVMKAKDIVKHKVTNEVGFILCLRDDLENRCNVQWIFDSEKESNLSYTDRCLVNQGCYSFSELEVVYSV